MNLSKKAKDSRRRNARKSTGPRTIAGKARVAKNALSHGLSIPYGSTPGSQEAIDQLARLILESLGISDEDTRPDNAMWTAARHFAEAQLDLDRIRLIRLHTLQEEIVKIRIPTAKQLARILDLSERAPFDPKALVEAERLSRMHVEVSKPPVHEKYKMIGSLLHRIDRYERRALSRRRKALLNLTYLQPI